MNKSLLVLLDEEIEPRSTDYEVNALTTSIRAGKGSCEYNISSLLV